MKIDYIKLQNYRQYRNPREIDFNNPDQNKNFVIIEGATGAGKSNLLNAVTWCLYGKEIHLKESAKGLPMVNTIAINESNIDDFIYIVVEIQMTDEDEKQVYKFIRRLTYRKMANGVEKVSHADSQEIDGSEFKAYELKHNDWNELSHPSSIVSRYMPESIMEYFFFDGEQLDEYFKEASGEKIRRAIFDISKLDLLERVIKNLESVKKDLLMQERHKLPKAVNELQEKINFSDKRIEEFSQKVKSIKEVINKAEKNKKSISKKLKELSSDQVKQIAGKREQLKQNKDELEDEIDQKKEEINQNIVENAPIIYGYKALVKTNYLIGDNESIPPKYKKSFLKSLLKEKVCICGINLETNKDCRKTLENLLDECPEYSDISGEIIEINANNKALINDINIFSEKQTQLNLKYKELDEERKKIISDIEDIDRKLAGVNDEDIRETENHYQEIERAIRDECINLGEFNKRLNDELDKKRNLEKELVKELKKKSELKDIEMKREFCNLSIGTATIIKNEIMQEIREKIEEKTKQQFAELHYKKEKLEVTIDTDYIVSIKDKFNMDTIDTLSAGERQLFALSFLAALNNVSGFKAPILIDTPLGRLAGEPKENIANNLPNYLQDRQVTMLVTDQEYTNNVREKLISRVGKEYKIIFDETHRGNQAEIELYK